MTVHYHESFWVVAGTAAPVISLAAIIAIGESLGAVRTLSRATEQAAGRAAARAAGIADRLNAWTFGISMANVAAQGVVLAAALGALYTRNDSKSSLISLPIGPVAASALLLAGIVGLFATAMLTAMKHTYAAEAREPGPPRDGRQRADGDGR